MKAIINEPHFYYKDLVLEITDDILENLSLSINYDQRQYYWPYDMKIDDEEEYLNFTYNVDRYSNQSFSKDDIFATSGLDECCLPHVKMNMIIRKNKWMKKHTYKYAGIANVVAHELHHLTQDFDLVDYKPGEKLIDYFLNPIEIEAFHIGFRAEADLSGKSIERCIRLYLDNYLNDNRINKKEYESIFVKWLNPAIKLLKGVSNES